VWEGLWLGATEPEKTFLQGLIQCAAAFHHYSRGNRNGARSLLAAGVEKLEKFPDDHRGINLTALRAAARQFLLAPANHPVCVPLPAPQIQVL
jgi:predicted metal-dependent hydrolase